MNPAAKAERKKVSVICFGLFVLVWAVFGQTAGFDFVNYDDGDYVIDNTSVTRGLSLKGAAWAFSTFHSSNWHPLTWLSHELDCQLYGLRAGGHHATNVLIHSFTVVFLFLVLRGMTGALWRSAFASAVFAIHPLRVESVAWVSERKDVLSALFFVLTVGAYVRYVRHGQGKASYAAYALVVLFFALGLMCKPMLVTVPLVLLLLDFWPLRRVESLGKLIAEKLPLVALAAADGVVTMLAQREAIDYAAVHSAGQRLGNALVACVVYLWQTIWPAGLAVLYPFPKNGPQIWEPALAAILLAGVAALVWRQRQTRPWLLVGWGWYLVMLLPVLGIVQVGAQAHADRYTYLPQIGICVAATWLVAEHAAKWSLGLTAQAGIGAVVLAALMVCAWVQTSHWKNSETLWKHTLACTTNNSIAYYNLGLDLADGGRLKEGIADYQKSIAIDPKEPRAWNGLARALRRKGQVNEAVADYRRALQLKPDYLNAHYNLAIALEQLGDTNGAVAEYENTLQLNHDYASAHNNLGNILLQRGAVAEAISHFKKALEINPDYTDAQNNLANALRRSGSVDDAIDLYQKALASDPGNAQVHYNLGLVLLKKGEVSDAIDHFQAAVKIQPANADAHFSLGTAFLQKGNAEDAAAEFHFVLRLRPDDADTLVNLGYLSLQQGNIDDAIHFFQKALSVKPNDADALNNLGNAFLRKGNAADAIRNFQKAHELKPEDPSIGNNLAWLLATCEDKTLRNGRKAVELAEQANTLAGGKNPLVLHTLAAAFAESGKFSDAVRSDQQAISLEQAAGNAELAQRFAAEVKRYQAGLPFSQ